MPCRHGDERTDYHLLDEDWIHTASPKSGPCYLLGTKEKKKAIDSLHMSALVIVDHTHEQTILPPNGPIGVFQRYDSKRNFNPTTGTLYLDKNLQIVLSNACLRTTSG